MKKLFVLMMIVGLLLACCACAATEETPATPVAVPTPSTSSPVPPPAPQPAPPTPNPVPQPTSPSDPTSDHPNSPLPTPSPQDPKEVLDGAMKWLQPEPTELAETLEDLGATDVVAPGEEDHWTDSNGFDNYIVNTTTISFHLNGWTVSMDVTPYEGSYSFMARLKGQEGYACVATMDEVDCILPRLRYAIHGQEYAIPAEVMVLLETAVYHITEDSTSTCVLAPLCGTPKHAAYQVAEDATVA